jgi:hypothetical protein
VCCLPDEIVGKKSGLETEPWFIPFLRGMENQQKRKKLQPIKEENSPL